MSRKEREEAEKQFKQLIERRLGTRPRKAVSPSEEKFKMEAEITVQGTVDNIHKVIRILKRESSLVEVIDFRIHALRKRI